MKFKTRATVKESGNKPIQEACLALEHYHIEHTFDVVTRFKATGSGADIYVVQDAEWKARLEKCVEGIFPRKAQ